MKSACCKEEMKVEGGDENTMFYRCLECGKACDIELPKPKLKKIKINNDFHFETECLNPDCKMYGKDMTLIWSHITDYVDDQGRSQLYTQRLYQCDYCKTIKVV